MSSETADRVAATLRRRTLGITTSGGLGRLMGAALMAVDVVAAALKLSLGAARVRAPARDLLAPNMAAESLCVRAKVRGAKLSLLGSKLSLLDSANKFPEPGVLGMPVEGGSGLSLVFLLTVWF